MTPAQAVVGERRHRIEPGGNPLRCGPTRAKWLRHRARFRKPPLLGAGNKGTLSHRITRAPYVPAEPSCTQITAFLAGEGGRIYAATGNVGKVYEIGPGTEREGTIESDVFDSGMFSNWGRLSFDAKMNGGQVAVATRSGNHDQPQKNWSPWSGHHLPNGERMDSPAARFVHGAPRFPVRRGRSPIGDGGRRLPAPERGPRVGGRDHRRQLQVPPSAASPRPRPSACQRWDAGRPHRFRSTPDRPPPRL
jgi:hypothetical protein